MPRAFSPPEECPVCGEPVPLDARACPGCGADERTGWNEDAVRYDGLNLPDEAFDDEREHQPAPRAAGDIQWFVITILVVMALITFFVIR